MNLQKNKRYIVQFPKHVSTDERAQYLSKMQKGIEEDQFTVVDSDVKIFEAATVKQDELPIDAPAPKEEPKPEPTPEPTPAPAEDTGVKVETVETKKAPTEIPKDGIFPGENEQ